MECILSGYRFHVKIKIGIAVGKMFGVILLTPHALLIYSIGVIAEEQAHEQICRNSDDDNP
jgi:hypothetical protein